MTRIGASQVFFNIVAQFNAEKLIKDYRSINTVMKAVSLDTFEAILKPIEGLGQGINQITAELGPLQEGLGLAAVEFEKFFGTLPAMEAMRDEVMELGQEFAQTGVEALNAGSRAAQVANLVGRGNVTTLTKLAYTLAEISDLNAEEAQRGIIQLHQQTGMLFGDMNREQFIRLGLQEQQNVLVEEGAKALDALNTIANRSVALEGDLVRVMGTFAAQGELVGDSFEFMAAASATLLEAGEEQGTAGRALRMMYARLGGDVSGARSKIEDMGFELMENKDKMKNMQDILTELSDKGWANFSGAQKQNIAQTIAGNRHYVRFIKLMENYERTMQLAADGAKGFDSALGQANKALSTEVNLLKKAQIENENLRAKIGEGLTPFMRGQVEVQNNYLRVTEVLSDSLGGLGVVLGKLKGTMEVMGGFIKIGLATQSLGIGFEMFTSVQRQLNGILVANEHLHSKQANYMQWAIRPTQQQRDLMAGMQFIQQKINMHAEQRRAIEKVLSSYLERQVFAEQQISALEEKRAVTTEKYFRLSNSINAAGKLRLANMQSQDSLYAKRMARIEYERVAEGSMLQEAADIRAAKGATEEAFMRQHLADMQVAAQLTDEELLNIQERHELLRAEHLLLQTLKADNEIRYRSQGGNRDGQAMPIDLEFAGSTVAMSQHERQFIAEKMEAFSDRARQDLNKRFDKEGLLDEDALSQKIYAEGELEDIGKLHDALNGYSMSMKVLDKNTGEYTAGEANLLKRMMEETQGQFIQTSKSLDIHNSMTKDQIKINKELTTIDFALVKVQDQLEGQNREIIDLQGIEEGLLKKIEPLLKKINHHKTNEIQRNEALLELSAQLNAKREDLSDTAKGFLQNEKEQLKFAEDKTMAFRQFGFAMQNSIGLLSGMIGGSTGAAMSMAFMSGNILMAGKQATTAAFQIASLSVQQTYNAITANTASAASIRLAGSVGTLNASLLVATGTLATMLAPLAALGAGISMIYKDGEKTKQSLEDLNKEMLTMEGVIESISPEKTLLHDETLAQTIGLDNMTTKEMLENTDSIDNAMKKLQDAQGRFTENQNTQIDNALTYLGVLVDTNDYQQNTLNKDLFAQTKRDAFSRLGDKGFGLKSFFENDLGMRKDAQAAGEELFDTIYGATMSNETGLFGSTSTTLGENMTTNLGTLFAAMESGYKLSEEQMGLAEEYFNDDAITTYLRSMNQLVFTEEMREYNQTKLAESIENTNDLTDASAEGLKNLTDEIYSFSGAREELFFGGKYGNVTGSLYKTVVKQGVGTLYHKNEVIMTTNFHGFFNEKEAADRITRIVTDVLATQ
jgi:TP901 family phage tail tape measure protein